MKSFSEPFDRPPHRHQEASVVIASDFVEVRTSAAQWAYAVSYDVAGRLGATPSVIHVTARVVSGVVGIGCLHTTETAFVDEQFVGSTEGPAHLALVIHDPGAVSRLVIRNAAPESASCVQILDIRQEPIFDRDNAREPPLTEPRPSVGWNRFYGTTGQTPIEQLRVQKFAHLTEPTTIAWIDGTRFRVYPGDQLSRALYVSGTYEPNTLTVLKALTPVGGVFVDVGANAGVMSVAAAAWVGGAGTVVSIEPSSREFNRLLENLALNQIATARPIRAAVAEREGLFQLRVAAGSYGGLNTLGADFAYDGVPIERHEEVEAFTLDELAVRERLERVDVIKVDVEGAEGTVLAGARDVLRHHRPVIVLEVFSRALAAMGWSRPRLAGELRTSGYSLFRLDHRAHLLTIDDILDVDEQNLVALPSERAADMVEQVSTVIDGLARGAAMSSTVAILSRGK